MTCFEFTDSKPLLLEQNVSGGISQENDFVHIIEGIEDSAPLEHPFSVRKCTKEAVHVSMVKIHKRCHVLSFISCLVLQCHRGRSQQDSWPYLRLEHRLPIVASLLLVLNHFSRG